MGFLSKHEMATYDEEIVSVALCGCLLLHCRAPANEEIVSVSLLR